MLKILIVPLLFAVVNHAAIAQIYKYTDENGNIHYTDKKPSEDAQETKLKPITIVESRKSGSSTNWKRERHKEKFNPLTFENFAISSPTNEESIWGTGGNLSVSVNLESKLPVRYRIKFYLDNIPHGRVKSNTQLIADVERGEHTVYATVIEARSRKVIKTTPKVTFYLKQHSKK